MCTVRLQWGLVGFVVCRASRAAEKEMYHLVLSEIYLMSPTRERYVSASFSSSGAVWA